MQQTIPDLLKPYGAVLSKPQFNHFSCFINSLAVCEIPSISRFAEIHNKDRACLNRFLTQSPWSIEKVKNTYHKQLNCYTPPDSFLILDDSISHRPYAIKVDKANWHYDHTTNKKELGYSIVTSVLAFNDTVVPYDLLPYYRKVDCTDRKFLSKNDIAEKIILSTKDNPKISTAIYDTWYSNDKVIGACKDANKHYITQIKGNRNVTISRRKNAVRSFVRLIEDWNYFLYNNNLFRIFATSAFISKVGSVHLIFSEMYNEDNDSWSETNYIISDMVEKESQLIVREYLTRVGIEGFHREAKQNTGLEGYFLRNNRGIERYLFLVMLAYATLVLQSLSLEASKTIGEMCEENKVTVYERAFNEIERHPAMKEAILKGLARARV